MQNKENKNKFCAVNNTKVMLFDKNKLPVLTQINEIISSNEFKVQPLKPIYTKTNLKIQEFLFEEPVFIHSINKTSSSVTLNKVKSIIEYHNVKEMYKFRPYLLHSFDITQKHCLIDELGNFSNLDLQNIQNTTLLKNNKYFGKRIDKLENLNLELDMNFGYIMGQWYSRGYIDKGLKQDPRFTWVSLEEDVHKLLNLITKTTHSSIFHKSKLNNEKYDYIQLVDYHYNQILFDVFLSNKFFAPWIYSAPYSFLNGLIYGIFFTNGTISFNKDDTKAYMTIKFLNQSLAECFGDLLNIRYNLQGVLSLVPDKKYCKVSYQLNKSFFKILENGFKYGYIYNENKEELMEKIRKVVTLPDFDNNPLSQVNFKVQKLSLNVGYNFKVINSNAFSLLNGVLVPSIT